MLPPWALLWQSDLFHCLMGGKTPDASNHPSMALVGSDVAITSYVKERASRYKGVLKNKTGHHSTD